MHFYKVDRRSSLPPEDAVYPCVLLTKDGWNDYSYQTLWGLTIYKSKGIILVYDTIKILQKDPEKPLEGKLITTLPSAFQSLTEDYCSLMQSMEAYNNLYDAGIEIYQPFLTSIRDVATSKDIQNEFEFITGFQKSLLRFSEAEKAFKEAKGIFSGTAGFKDFKFSFSCTVPGASAPHVVEFDFSHHATELNRVTVFIGRNGTGKTQFLAQFAQAMSGLEDIGFEFSPKRPSFSRVIAVSYSVFDQFKRPTAADRTFSYFYCGIRAPDDESLGAKYLSADEIKDRLSMAISMICENDEKLKNWEDIIKELLTDAVPEESVIDKSLEFYRHLSSGQKILVAVMTDVIAYIKADSIILFDEPELHLHPEMLVALSRSINKLLKVFDSYAIIATHAPLLLQETLSRQVRVFRRKSGKCPVVEVLPFECFGETITSITREVFSVDSEKLNFRQILDGFLVTRSPESVESLFPLGLPIQAQAYLEASNSK